MHAAAAPGARRLRRACDGGTLDSETDQEKATLSIVPLTDRLGFRVTGEVDLSNRAALEAALDLVCECGADVHLDVRDLSFIDVGAVSLLVRKSTALSPGKHLVLHNPSPALRRIIGLLWGSIPTIELDTP
jgi:anti-anti-sigma factor